MSGRTDGTLTSAARYIPRETSPFAKTDPQNGDMFALPVLPPITRRGLCHLWVEIGHYPHSAGYLAQASTRALFNRSRSPR